jgi:hypothetical protein
MGRVERNKKKDKQTFLKPSQSHQATNSYGNRWVRLLAGFFFKRCKKLFQKS